MQLSPEVLENYLNRLGVAAGEYSIGAEIDSRVCALPVDEGWSVFYSERGLRTDEVGFENQDVALIYLLGLFTQQQLDRGSLTEATA
ncbi:hypothetical protein [Kribbella sp. CA-293567]|uniref:hypothetical protein n=1 Tax=Kribbella sp. CA-293567 TaxID=3002436 RepID=UPI0022DE7CBE|nr:hypothetical protein [Kribbella sp. CA-293567]WBQ06484.1 hypothetical protein OX958_06745 [Kribbella sp. CA-293567]